MGLKNQIEWEFNIPIFHSLPQIFKNLKKPGSLLRITFQIV